MPRYAMKILPRSPAGGIFRAADRTRYLITLETGESLTIENSTPNKGPLLFYAGGSQQPFACDLHTFSGPAQFSLQRID
jgi:hypothetical protein